MILRSPKTRTGRGSSGAHASQKLVFVEQIFLAAKNAIFSPDKLSAGTSAALSSSKIAEACVHAVRKLRGVSDHLKTSTFNKRHYCLPKAAGLRKGSRRNPFLKQPFSSSASSNAAPKNSFNNN